MIPQTQPSLKVAVHVSLTKWRTGVSVAMTTNSVHRKVGDYKRARKHCLQVLRLARMFGHTKLVNSRDFGSFAVLISALGDDAVERFFEETLLPILEYEHTKKICLLQSTEAFLQHGCRYQAAASALDINVSTLRYRLKRMRELFGFDIESNEDDRFTLLLALRIKKLRH